MSVYPKVLAALRAAELLRLEEVDLQRHVAVPWVAAALGEKWHEQEAYELAGFPDTIQRLEENLAEHASPSVKRLKRYAQLGALGNTNTEYASRQRTICQAAIPGRRGRDSG